MDGAKNLPPDFPINESHLLDCRELVLVFLVNVLGLVLWIMLLNAVAVASSETCVILKLM